MDTIKNIFSIFGIVCLVLIVLLTAGLSIKSIRDKAYGVLNVVPNETHNQILSNNAELQETIILTQGNIQALTSQNKVYESTITAHENTIAQNNALIEHYRTELNNVNSQYSSEIASLQNEITNLNQTIAMQNQQITDLQMSLENTHSMYGYQIENYQNEVNNLNNAIFSLQNDIASKEQTIQTLQQRIMELENNQTSDNTEYLTQITTLQNENADLTERVAYLENQINENANNLEKYEALSQALKIRDSWHQDDLNRLFEISDNVSFNSNQMFFSIITEGMWLITSTYHAGGFFNNIEMLKISIDEFNSDYTQLFNLVQSKAPNLIVYSANVYNVSYGDGTAGTLFNNYSYFDLAESVTMTQEFCIDGISYSTAEEMLANYQSGKTYNSKVEFTCEFNEVGQISQIHAKLVVV